MFEFILRYIMLSSAEADTRLNVLVDVVDVHKKSIGPRTEPCGTPDVTSVMSDRAPLKLNFWKYPAIHTNYITSQSTTS